MRTIIELPSLMDIKETKFDELDVELILFYYQTESSHENDHDTAILFQKNNSFYLYHEHENIEQESFYRTTVEVCNLGKEINRLMGKEFVDYIKVYALNHKLEKEIEEKPAIKKMKI